MATKPKWTVEEDSILLAQVKASPQNLQQAFEATASMIGRTPTACNYRWYTHLSKIEDKSNTCFITLSRTKYGRNRKNCKEDIPAPKLSKWRRILNILFE